MTANSGALMAALRFGEADLQANRQGQLSPAQAARLKKMRQRQSLLAAALFAFFVIGATILLYAGQRGNNLILSGAGALLILVNAILVGRMGRAWMRISGDLRLGAVQALAGDVQRVLRRGRQGDSYLLRIACQCLPVNKQVFLGFQHNAPYRIYRSRHAGLLLSAEAIGQPRKITEEGRP